MRAFAIVLGREIAERRLLALAAALLGLVPLAVPFLPLGFSRAPDARSGTAIGLALIVSYVLALVLGSGMIARDLAERRLGFYFSRPLPGWAIWAGKLAGAALLAIGSGILVLLPSLLLGDRPEPSASWGQGLGREMGFGLGFLLWLATVLALLLAANAVAVMVRSRSPWLLLDLLAGTVLAALVWVAAERLLSAWALGALALAQAGLLAAAVVSFAVASAVQVTCARTDPRRGHRLLSLTLWLLLGLAVLAYGGYAQWVLAAAPEDLVEIAGAIPAPAGDWIALGGDTGPGRGEYGPTFLLDTSSGRFVRIGAQTADWGGLAFSRDGRYVVWTRMAGRTTFPVTIHALDLGRPGAQPVATPVGFSKDIPHSLVLSPDGRRLACIVGQRVVAQELTNGRLLLAAPVLPSEIWEQNRLRFLDSRILRFYATRLNQEGSELRVLDFDLDTGRRVREIRLPDRHSLQSIDRDGQRVLLASRGEPDRAEIAIADLRTGEPPAGLQVEGNVQAASFLPDGRAVILLRSQGRSELLLLDASGVERKRFALPGRRVRFGGQPAPGLLVVASTDDSRFRGAVWRSDLLDLGSGALRPIGEGLFPEGWPSLPVGSVGAQLFIQKEGGLVRIDPASGRLRVILRIL